MELPVRERITHPERRHTCRCRRGPVIGRHVLEAEVGIGKSCHGVGAPRRGVHARKEAIDQHGGLIARHGFLAQERSVREGDIDTGVGQPSDGLPPPLVATGLRQPDG